MAWLAACAALIASSTFAQAAPPLIYEGTLTTGDPAQPPDPWPGLRFSVVDAAGEAWWSTLVDPGGPLIEVGPDGRFVAYLEDSPQNPWAIAGFDQGRWLRVDVCPGAWPANPEANCQWVQLEQTQRIGTVPNAATAGQIIMDALDLHVNPEALPAAPGVPAFGSLREALAWLDDYLIGPTGLVTIRLAPGVYPPGQDAGFDEPIVITREDGQRIHIVGVEDDPEVVRLRFRTSGIVVDEGARLGRLAGVTLVGQGDPEARGSGLVVQHQGFARLASGVAVTGFSGHCVAVVGGTLLADGIEVSDCGYMGISVQEGGYARVRSSRVDNVDQDGVGAVAGSIVMAHDSTVTNARRQDYAAHSTSYIASHRICRTEGAAACLIAASNLGYISAQDSNLHQAIEQSLAPGYIRTAPNEE